MVKLLFFMSEETGVFFSGARSDDVLGGGDWAKQNELHPIEIEIRQTKSGLIMNILAVQVMFDRVKSVVLVM